MQTLNSSIIDSSTQESSTLSSDEQEKIKIDKCINSIFVNFHLPKIVNQIIQDMIPTMV